MSYSRRLCATWRRQSLSAETDVAHRAVLREAAEALAAALQARQQSGTDDTAGLTPQEEVRLLHIME